MNEHSTTSFFRISAAASAAVASSQRSVHSGLARELSAASLRGDGSWLAVAPEVKSAALKALSLGFERECLDALFACHAVGYEHAEISERIFSVFASRSEAELKTVYEKNTEAFGAYGHVSRRDFPAFNDVRRRFFACSDGAGGCSFAYYDRRDSTFGWCGPLKIAPPSFGTNSVAGTAGVLNGIYDTQCISSVLAATSGNCILTQKVPIYLHYDDFEEFCSHLQLFDYTAVLASERAVFAFGSGALESYLMRRGAVRPGFAFSMPGPSEAALDETLAGISNKRAALHERNVTEMNAYYISLRPIDILDRIHDGSLRIGILTTRFSTAVQYNLKDCAAALERLGYTTGTLIEEEDILFNDSAAYIDFVNSFRPDVILLANHFRWEEPLFPQTPVCVCWIQDFLPNLLSRESASKMGRLDFVINQFGKSLEFKNIGYPPDRSIDAPIPADPLKYRIHELTAEEFERFGADVCVISNSGDVEKPLNDFVNKFSSNPVFEKIRAVIMRVFARVYDDVYREKASYFNNDSIAGVFSEEFSREGISAARDNLLAIAEDFRIGVVFMIYKVVPVTWLHERGYDMKLWGRPWPGHETFGRYAKGIAPNGEGMSKILNASKISIGLNGAVTLHPRVMESLMSGCLYIGNNIPAGDDWTDVREYLREDSEVVLFYGRNDLYNKIDMYLSNENLRREIVERGRARAMESLTYDAVMKKTIDRIAEGLAGLRADADV